MNDASMRFRRNVGLRAMNETKIACGYDSTVGYGYITIDKVCTKNKDFLLDQTQVNVLVAV